MQNLNLICVIGTVETYLEFWGEGLNFGITIAEIQPKVWERIRKVERENVEFRQRGYQNRGIKFFFSNCGNGIAENWKKKEKKSGSEIYGRVKKKKSVVHNIFTINHMWLVIISSNKNLWQPNCGNAIAEIGE